MRKWIVGAMAGLAIVTSNAGAQGVYQGPLPFEAQWTVSALSGGEAFAVDLLFRNTSGWTKGGFWSVDGVNLERSLALGGCLDSCGVIHSYVGVVGAVDQRNLGVYGSEPLVAGLQTWTSAEPNNAISTTGILFGPRGVGAEYVRRDNLGLLGCTIPRNDLLSYGGEPIGYAYGGRTCAAGDYDGWIYTRSVFSAPFSGPLSADDFTVTPVMTFVQAATVPTPATTPMLMTGVLGVLIRARRRVRAAARA